MRNIELYYDILQKKYNILKKNLIIIEQTDKKINEFRDAIIKLDEIEQNKFKKDLEPKKELTTNLEDEYKRLCDYINLVQSRQRRRNSMLEDYYNIVKEKIDGLEEIEGYNDIGFYNKRLEDITVFFENDDKYNKLSNEKKEYLTILNGYNEKKSILEETLNDFEIDLLIKLRKSIESNEVYNGLDFDNIDKNINNYEDDLNDKEKELSTYINSYNVLIDSHIEENEKNQYLDFIKELKKEYLILLEKKYILLLYKYINNNQNEEALDTYKERLEQLKKYDLEDYSDLKDIFIIIENYIDKELSLMELNNNINSISESIKEVDYKINSIKDELNKQNIVNLLKEFCIKKDYIVDNNDVNLDFVSEDNFIDKDNYDKLKTDSFFINEEELRGSFDQIDEIKEDIDIFEKENVIELDNVEQIINNDNSSDDSVICDESINSEDYKEVVTEEKNIDFGSEILNDINNFESINSNIDDTLSFDKKNDNMDNVELNIDAEIKNEIIYKENAIKEIKDFNKISNLDNILDRALSIMKSVCESVI